MRNIKITALLLAVLMVVSAFAGCASSSDLENKVNEQANAIAGIQDSIKDLADAIANQGSSSELDDIKADIAENKQDAAENKQNIADILEAINGLKDAVAGATGENEDVKTAIAQAGAKIDAAKGLFEDNKKHYTAEDIAAIREIYGVAQAAISTCVTVEAVAAAVAAMEADLAKHVRVDDSIYAYVVALEGNITDASAEKVAEAVEALEAAVEFYEDDMDALEEYEVGDDEINLVEKIGALETAQTVTLETIKAQAKQLVKDIDKAAEAYSADDLYDLLSAYKTWVKAAKKLSAENVALVTNYDKLTAALEDAQNVETAIREFNTSIWELESLLAEDVDAGIFFDYLLLVSAAEEEELGLSLSGIYAIPTEDGKLLKVADIYKAIDAKLAEFKAEYELSDEAYEYVIAEATGDDYLLAKYEADKAVAATLAAEFETLNKGVFAAIKSLNAKKLSAANALELVNAFEKNAKDIIAWKDALIAAYKAEYAKIEDATLVTNYTVADYAALVELAFNVMVIEGKLCVYDAEDKTYADYWYGFDTDVVVGEGEDAVKVNDSFFALYDFTKNADTAEFLTETYAQVKADAKVINDRIAAFQANQAISIVALATKIGGYVKLNEDGDKLVAYTEEDVADGVIDTIAEFVAAYEELGLAGLVNVDEYNAKLAVVEANIAKAEAALKTLMSAYGKLLGNKSTVVVTMDNVAEIKALEALLINWNKAGRADMVKAVAADTTVAGVQEYKLVPVIADYVAVYGADFAADVLDSTDYTSTSATKDTGAIVRLIHKAKALETEALYVESAYKMMKALNDATGGKAFAYTTLNNASALLAKFAADNSDTFYYGILGVDYTEQTVNGVTTYKATAKMIRFEKGVGFRQGTIDAGFQATKSDALKATVATVKSQMVYKVAEATAAEFVETIFVDLADDIKTTNSDKLTTLFPHNAAGSSTNIIPGYALPMIAMYLEAKFVINNMGKTTDAITAAKAGWGTAASNYGFDYIKAMVVNKLRTVEDTNLTTSALTAIGNTIDYNELTVAVNNTLVKLENGFGEDITFGHADAEWLSDLYDIRVELNADGSYDDVAADYADHDIDLSKLAVDVITIYINEAEEEELE